MPPSGAALILLPRALGVPKSLSLAEVAQSDRHLHGIIAMQEKSAPGDEVLSPRRKVFKSLVIELPPRGSSSADNTSHVDPLRMSATVGAPVAERPRTHR